MKNILFATTALVATAGIASADVSLSGSANVGIINNGIDTLATAVDPVTAVNGANGVAGVVGVTQKSKAMMYQNISLTAAMSGESDNGLTFGASLTMRAGDDVDLDVGDLGKNDAGTLDDLTTAADEATAANSGSIKALSDMSFGSIYVGGEWGTLTFDREGIDNLMDDAFAHDMSYAYSAGDLSVSITADVAKGNATLGKGEKWSAKVGYTMDAITITALTDDSSETDVTVAYAMNDMIGLSVNLDSNGQVKTAANAVTGAAAVTKAETIVKATYANGAVSGHVAWANDDDDAWEVGLGYTSGAMTFGVVAAEDGAGTKTEMDVTASYDLGGGMSIKGATNETGAFFVGTALAF